MITIGPIVYAFLIYGISLSLTMALGWVVIRFLLASSPAVDPFGRCLFMGLSYLIGIRLLWFIPFILSFFGVSLSKSYIFVFSLGVVAIVFYFLNLVIGKRSDLISNNNSANHATKLTLPLALLLVISTVVLIINTVMPSYAWDHFTYWTLVPREMLFWNKLPGLYPVTQSCCLSYPPQQVNFGGFLLWLAGQDFTPDSFLNLLTPLHMCIAGLVLWEHCKESSLGNFATSLFISSFLIISYAFGVYFSQFYGDSLILCYLLMIALALPKFFALEPTFKRSVLLGMVISSATIGKPYTFSVFFALCLLPLVFRAWRRYLPVVLSTGLGLFVGEYLLYRLVVRNNVEVSRYIKLTHISTPSIERLLSWPISHTSLLVALSIAVPLISGAVFCIRYARQRTPNLIIPIYITLSMTTPLILLFTMWPKLTNSADRYLSNLLAVCFLILIELFRVFATEAEHRVARNLSITRKILCNIYTSRFLMKAFLLGICLVSMLYSVCYGPYVKQASTYIGKLISGKSQPFPQLAEKLYHKKIFSQLSHAKNTSGYVLLGYKNPSTQASLRWIALLAPVAPNLRLLGLVGYRDDFEYQLFWKLWVATFFATVDSEVFRKHNVLYILFPSIVSINGTKFYGLVEIDEFLRLTQP